MNSDFRHVYQYKCRKAESAEWQPMQENMDFIQVQLEVKCADGSSTKPSDLNYNGNLAALPSFWPSSWQDSMALQILP